MEQRATNHYIPLQGLARGLLRGMGRLSLLALFKIQRTGKVNFPKLWRSNRVVFGNGCKKTARWRLDADRTSSGWLCLPSQPWHSLWFARLSGCSSFPRLLPLLCLGSVPGLDTADRRSLVSQPVFVASAPLLVLASSLGISADSRSEPAQHVGTPDPRRSDPN